MRYLLLITCFIVASFSHALSLKPNAPTRYVVQHGDSLWGIANKFLVHPWEWKELWRANPKIHNPNRLYAGDVLVLDYYRSMPYIKVLSNGTIKLSPATRLSPLDNPIPAIPLSLIQPFLNSSLVLDENILPLAPYIIAFMGEHLVGGQGNEAYVKGLHPVPELPVGGTIAYSILRAGKTYVHPLTKKILGYKATLIGYGELVAGGEPATILLTSINEGVHLQDKVLINNSPEFDANFNPQAPGVPVAGAIIDMPTGMPYPNSQEAVGEVIVISVGAYEGLKAGDVLGLFNKPRFVKDPKNSFTPIKLPPERLGEAMIFRTFSHTSFALIVRSIRPIYIMDIVSNP